MRSQTIQVLPIDRLKTERNHSKHPGQRAVVNVSFHRGPHGLPLSRPYLHRRHGRFSSLRAQLNWSIIMFSRVSISIAAIAALVIAGCSDSDQATEPIRPIQPQKDSSTASQPSSSSQEANTAGGDETSPEPTQQPRSLLDKRHRISLREGRADAVMLNLSVREFRHFSSDDANALYIVRADDPFAPARLPTFTRFVWNGSAWHSRDVAISEIALAGMEPINARWDALAGDLPDEDDSDAQWFISPPRLIAAILQDYRGRLASPVVHVESDGDDLIFSIREDGRDVARFSSPTGARR